MKILIAGLIKSGQVDRLREEAEKRGHTLEGIYSSDLVIYSSPDKFEPTLKGVPFDHDLIYLWVISKRRWEWIAASYFLNKTKGIKIVNQKMVDPSYVYIHSAAADYLKQTENNLPFPKSAVVCKPQVVDEVMKDFQYPVIIKKSIGRKGKGVFKVNSAEEIKKIIRDHKEETPAFVIREFIPNDGDIRVFTVGYRAIGAMKRTPAKGNFRSNLYQGGKGSAYDLSHNPRIKEIAEKISELTRTEIAGVDIVLHAETGEPYILEVNAGPQFKGLEKYTKINAALEIIKYFESLVAEKS